jgi:ribosomal-protein-alanine N-acetyltransferase
MEDIYLRPFEMNDSIFIHEIRSDETMDKIGGVKRFIAQEKDDKWIKDIIMSDGNECIYLAICIKEQHNIIGYTSVSDIDYRNGTCFWSGLKISKEHAGKGFGYKTAMLILKHVFEELRIVRCTAMALEEHNSAIGLLEKAGYKKEGLMRKYVYKDGEHKNNWLFSILREEYYEAK